jgi:T-complex protein 1 subunit theta
VEVELARQINQFAEKCPGLDQYAIQRFAQALETFPRILSDNAGLKTTETVAALLAAHQEGKATTGICVDVSFLSSIFDNLNPISI